MCALSLLGSVSRAAMLCSLWHPARKRQRDFSGSRASAPTASLITPQPCLTLSLLLAPCGYCAYYLPISLHFYLSSCLLSASPSASAFCPLCLFSSSASSLLRSSVGAAGARTTYVATIPPGRRPAMPGGFMPGPAYLDSCCLPSHLLRCSSLLVAWCCHVKQHSADSWQ